MAKVRVHELAREFGVESKVILEKLADLGEFVKSPSSTVEPRVVKRFTDRYGTELRQQSRLRAAALRRSRPRPDPFTRAALVDDKLAEAAAVLGVPVHELKPAQQPRRPRTARRGETKPLTSWKRNLFDKEERELWTRAGLGQDDGDLAARLVMEGITPEDLRLPIRGMRAVARLRGGESHAMVIRDILDAKRQPG